MPARAATVAHVDAGGRRRGAHVRLWGLHPHVDQNGVAAAGRPESKITKVVVGLDRFGDKDPRPKSRGGAIATLAAFATFVACEISPKVEHT
eukprot:6641912-Prymnesium_polylepis.1